MIEPRQQRAIPLGHVHASVRRITGGAAANSGKPFAEMEADRAVWRDAQPTVTGCLFCDWSHEGSAVDGREAARAHRVSAHPEVARRKKRGRQPAIGAWKPAGTRAGNEVIELAREKRAEREQAQLEEKLARAAARDGVVAVGEMAGSGSAVVDAVIPSEPPPLEDEEAAA